MQCLLFTLFVLAAVTDGFSSTQIFGFHNGLGHFPSPTSIGASTVLENEEPLSVIFQRAVVLQRSGDHKEALKEYELFIKAAEQCDVSPVMYAEVHVNIGAVYVKEKNTGKARYHFEKALQHRQVGTAHVNLALLALQQGSKTINPTSGYSALKDAKIHCEKAIELNDNEQSKSAALRLLEDINKILGKMPGGK